MKLLLCSDFKNVGYMFLSRFFNLSKIHKCLFIDYASEEFDGDADYTSSSMERIRGLNFEITPLTENFDFSENFDMIFVRGGNTTKLIYLLRKFGQYDKIKSLVEGGVLFVGESAGSVLAGNDTEWTLLSEPYEIDVKAEFGDNALKGFGFVNKKVFVHCSKFRFPYSGEWQGEGLVRFSNTEYYKAYLRDMKLYPKNSYITLGNNQVYLKNDDMGNIITYNWKHIPVID